MVFHLGRFWTGALPLDPGTNWRPTSWVEYLGCSRRVGEVKTKKHPSRLVVGRHVCGFAQDPLRVSAFLSYRTVCQKVFHSEHGVLFVEYLKNAIFKPSERISAPKYGINPQRSRKAKFDPFLNVCAVINGIGRFGSWYVSLQGNPYCRYQSHSGQHGIPMSNSFRGEQCSASPVFLLHQYRRWCATCFGRRT